MGRTWPAAYGQKPSKAMFRHRFMLTYSQNDARGILQASIFHELISEICLIVPRTTKKRNSACLQHRLEISHCPHRNLFAEMEWLIDWTIRVCRKPCFVFYPCLKRPVRISSLGFLEEEWEIQLVHLYQESYQGWCVYNMMNASLFNSLLLHL